MLKYEVRNLGLTSQFRLIEVSKLLIRVINDQPFTKLIVKNIKEADFTTFSAECNGVRLSAQLRQQSPYICPVRDEVLCYATGIEVIRTKVRPGLGVKWYKVRVRQDNKFK